jgi:glycosyltransferase involved in cell wall biosynthesis
MKASALIIAYNHEPFIARAIESAQMQQIEAPYEIVISEDYSTDRTREIVLDYAAGDPRIRPILSPRNLGGVENFVAAFHACTGQYVALLDGDDFWTSPLKVKKQVEFLDAHPQCSMCVHGVTEIDEDSGRQPVRWIPPGQKDVSTLEDLLLDNFVYTSAAMLRNGTFKDFPRWVYDFSLSDVPLWVQVAQHGDVGYLKEFLGVYRVHRGGVWSGKDLLFQVEQTMELYDRLIGDLAADYHDLLRRRRSRFAGQLACERAGVEAGALVLVPGGRDGELLKIGRPAEHFPGDADGPGGHLALDDGALLERLEQARMRGAAYLLAAGAGARWLEAHRVFCERIEARYECVSRGADCVLYDLRRERPPRYPRSNPLRRFRPMRWRWGTA